MYCSVDESFAAHILEEFERKTGIDARPVFDSEAGKTTGLVNRIRAERDRPRADVLFSGELFNTIALADEGLLDVYDSPAAADIPSRYRDPGRRWTAIGLRGRVLAYDPNRTSAEELPGGWEELSEPRFASRLALANPVFGTTRGHVAAMFACWGEDRARKFLRRLREAGALVVDGNSSAVRAVIDGRAAMCMTDTDDVWVAQDDGASLDLRYLAMSDGGTLWIPSTVAVVKSARSSANARRLVDFLVSSETEAMLRRSRSRNVPVRPALRAAMGIAEPDICDIPFVNIANQLGPSIRAVREILLK